MAEEVESLLVTLNASIKDYEKNLARALNVTTSQLRKVEKEAQDRMARVEGVFKNFGKGLLAGAGIASFDTIVRSMSQLVGQAAKIGDLADKLGAASTAVQELQYGAVQANIEFDELEKLLLKFSKSLGEAANGQGDLLEQLRANNIAIRDASGNMRPYMDLLKDFADLVKNAGSEQDQMLLVTQAFGRGGGNMLEFLRDGRLGLERFAAGARDAGAVIDDELIKKAQKVDDDWAALMQSMSQQAKKFAVEAASAFAGVFKDAQEIGTAIQKGDWKTALYGAKGKSMLRDFIESLNPPDQSLSDFDPREPRGPLNSRNFKVGPTTKVHNPEKAREEAKKRAEAERELTRALREQEKAQEDLAEDVERQHEQFESGFENLELQIQAMELEAETLGMTTSEIEKARAAQELYNLAQEQGIPLTEELSARIESAAQRFGDASQQLEELGATQERLAEVNSTLQDATEGFFNQIIDGVEPVEALKNSIDDLIKSLAKLFMQQALQAAFNPAGGGSGGLFAGLFKNKHGGINPRSVRVNSYQRGGIKHRPELSMQGDASVPEAVVPLPNGRSIPVKFRDAGGMRGGTSGYGYGKVVVNNYGGQVRQRETRGAGGDRQLELWFDANFDRRIGDSRMARYFKTAYGINPIMTRR